jgi:hypothetical protein
MKSPNHQQDGLSINLLIKMTDGRGEYQAKALSDAYKYSIIGSGVDQPAFLHLN